MSALPANRRYSHRSALLVSALTAAACLGLTGCSSVSNMTSGMSASAINPVNWITPYKVDVIQGNFISREQVELLKPGMTRAQVKDVLGTPLLASVFHENRWDYVFTLKRRNVEPQAFKYTVFFKGDQLERFEGDTMPSEAEFIATLASGRKLGKAPPLEATEEQLNKAAEKAAGTRSASAAAPAAPAPAGQPPAAYPPLESPAR
ncbi:MAG: outer membrane protein assembly factor BamE [Polaromonas sp.]|nr:outer membrane protein assembly factor BamE [Polaromonas sp.]